MIPFPPLPERLERYAAQFDDLFTRASQRQAFRQYLAGLLLPPGRNKTLTALANTEPLVGRRPRPPSGCSGSSPNRPGTLPP